MQVVYVIRVSHVLSADLPAKPGSARKALTYTSCSASSVA